MMRINQMELWIGKEEKRAMIEYLDSGGWLTEFKKTREFEQMIASANAVTLAGAKPVLVDIEGIEFVDINLEDTSPLFIDILVGEGKRDKSASFLDKKGIGTRPFYPAIHTQPPHSWIKGDFKNSEYISERGLWLPSSSFLSNKDIE